jgi:phospholipase/carboxylesterase
VARGLGALTAVALLYLQFGPRPTFLPLRTCIDGPALADAADIVIFLHGRNRNLAYAQRMVTQMREAGLPATVAIVLVEAPYTTGLGHHWGYTAEAQATARARLRARLTDLIGEGASHRGRITIAGFSQGAGIAIDTTVEDPRVSGLASFSPCLSLLRGDLPKREGIRILLAHGNSDTTCPVEESRSLARVLEAAHRPARYIEFEGGHTVPPEVVKAFVDFVTRR